MHYFFPHKYNFIHSAVSGSEQSRYMNEPTFLAFSVDFKFTSLFDDVMRYDSSPLLDIDAKYGAYNFLLSRGLNDQARALKQFVSKLRTISTTMPWFFQTCAGLNELWTADTDMTKPYKAQDKKIQIDTLESLDLSITDLAVMYRKAVYDTVYMRELLPENLRWFQCDIYVAEFRNLVLERGKFGVNDDYSFVRNNKHYIKFSLDMAEFDFSTTFPIEASVSTFETEKAKNSFSLTCGNFNIDAQINLGKQRSENTGGVNNVNTENIRTTI